MWKKIIFICVGLLIILILNEFLQGILRQKDRQKIYKKAQARAKELKKPLVVYGDPYYGKGSRFYNMFIKGYGCGDETVDLTGSPGCKNGVKSDMLKHLKSKKSNSQVIFVSCVLEYLNDIEEVFKEMKRVAGGVENIFVVTVSELTIAAYVYQEDNYRAENIIYAPPKFKDLTYKKI